MQQQLEALEHQEDRLGVLRDMRMQGVGQDDISGGGMTQSLAREIGRDRISRGEGTDVQKVRDPEAQQQRQELIRAIRENRVEAFG